MMLQRGRGMEPSHIFYRRRVMGSTGSLLNEGMYEKDGYHQNTTADKQRPRYLLDEHMLPSKMTPHSGRPDKPKGLIRPIAVRPHSPGSASSSPRIGKRGVESPALSDTVAIHGQPPDVILTNQRRGITSPNGYMPSSSHFGRPPTKTVSLQEIPPNFPQYTNGIQQSEVRGRVPTHKKLQPSQSMNFLDHSQKRNPPRQPPLERRGRSYSHSSIQDHVNFHIPDTSLTNQLNQSSLSPHLERRTASSSFDNQSVSSHVSSIIEEVSTDEEVPGLRTKVQELEAQLSTLRQAMEQNEQSILQVQADKRHEWQSEVSRLKKELNKQSVSAADNEQTLQSQVLRVEQENTRLRQKIEHLEEASLNLRNSNQQNLRKPPDENSNFKSKKSNMDAEDNVEVSDLREKVQICQQQLLLEREKVRKLEQDLDDARKHNWQETPDLVKKQFGCDQEEVKNLKASLEQLSEVKINLSKQVSIQEDELQLLQRKLEDRDKELAQEKSEIAYLRDIQDRLQVDLKSREKELKQVRSKNAELVSNLQNQVREKEMEVEAVHNELRELRLTKNQEITELEKQVLRKESESLKLQSQLQETESKSLTKNKRRSFKSSESLKTTQKQLEQDFIALQVKLTKREQEIFQLKREASLKLENVKEERDTVKRKLALCDGDLKTCRDKLQMRDEELAVFHEKLQDREKEIANLYDKLERQKQQSGRDSADRRNSEPMNNGDEQDNNRFKRESERSPKGIANIDVNEMKRGLQELQEKLRRQEREFEEEMHVWQKEKSQVLQYQKQLQLNYMQMGQKNRKLEQEVQQLSAELERTDVIHC